MDNQDKMNEITNSNMNINTNNNLFIKDDDDNDIDIYPNYPRPSLGNSDNFQN